MRSVLLRYVVVALGVVCAACDDPPHPSERSPLDQWPPGWSPYRADSTRAAQRQQVAAALAAAESRWRALAPVPAHYRYTAAMHHSGPAMATEVTVQHGAVAAVRAAVDSREPGPSATLGRTVPEWFALIGQLLATSGMYVEAAFDPALGFPTRFAFSDGSNSHAMMAIVLEGFTVLPAPRGPDNRGGLTGR